LLFALPSEVLRYESIYTPLGKKSRDDPIAQRVRHSGIPITNRGVRSRQSPPDDLTEAFRWIPFFCNSSF